MSTNLKLMAYELLYLVHVNCLKCFTSCENYGMILIIRLALSNICWFTRKPYPVNFLKINKI
jgi:hypothetical protein